MLSKFDVIGIIDDYSTEYEAESVAQDIFDDLGVKAKSSEPFIKRTGAFVNLTPNELKFDEPGAYTINDKKLYSLYKHKIKSKIKYNGLEYTIHSVEDISDYIIDTILKPDDGEEGVYVYKLKNEGRPLDDN